MIDPMRSILLLSSIAFFVACGTGTNTEGTADSAGRIRAMEDSVFESGAFDARKAQALVDVYKAYAKAHPNDSLAPEYLFRAANVLKSMHEGEKGVQLYDRIINDYPNWNKLADVFYLKAFTIDSEMDRKGEARTAYEQVIRLYPDHAFARDAKIMIENLQYTDAELIERFQKMQDSTGVVQ